MKPIHLSLLLSALILVAIPCRIRAAGPLGGVVITDEKLIPAENPPALFSEGMGSENKIEALQKELQKLRISAARVTIIVLDSGVLPEKISASGMTAVLSGGRLGTSFKCDLSAGRVCAFYAEPLASEDPDYKVVAESSGRAFMEKSIRPVPGGIVLVPLSAASGLASKRKEADSIEKAPLDIAGLKSPDEKVRIGTAKGLVEAPDPAAVDALVEALKDESIEVAFHAVEAIGRAYVEGYISAEKLFELEKDAAINMKARTGILKAIARVPDPGNAAFLLDVLKNGTADERRFVTGMLPYQGMKVAVPALIETLKDPDEWVSYNAWEQLKLISRGRDYGKDQEAWGAWWGEVAAKQK